MLLMKISSIILCTGIVLGNAAPLLAQQSAGGTVPLLPPSKQGQSGSAQLLQQGSDVVITIHALQDQTTAAMLSGKCTNTTKPDVSGPALPLKPLVNGSSQTTLANTTVAQLAATPHAIIVQGGAEPLLCGDVGTLSSQPPQP